MEEQQHRWKCGQKGVAMQLHTSEEDPHFAVWHVRKVAREASDGDMQTKSV